MDFAWKRNNQEPYITFKNGDTQNIKLYDKTAFTIINSIDNSFLKQLQEKGFAENRANSRSFLESPGDQNSRKEYQYAFEKNDQYYKLYIGLDSSIDIACTTRDPQIESLFDDFFNSPSIVSKFTADDVLSILDASYENVLELSVTNIEPSTGVAQYWGKINGQWRLLGITQDLPDCELFERYKVGRGVVCYDQKSQQSRIATY